MRGYTAKKGKRYYAVIYEGVDPATGKERRRWYPAGTRKADADKLVTELVKRRHDGDYRAPDKTTLRAYLTDKWLPAQRAQLRPSTFDSYERNIRLHVLPKLGNLAPAAARSRGSRRLLRRVALRRQAERGRRPEPQDGALHPRHPAQGAVRRSPQRSHPPERGISRRSPEAQRTQEAGHAGLDRRSAPRIPPRHQRGSVASGVLPRRPHRHAPW